MRITALDLTIGRDVGLAPGRMAPLGDLVVLAGPNGAGKSRIIDLVAKTLQDPALADGSVNGFRGMLAKNAEHLSRTGKPIQPPSQLDEWRATVARADAVTRDGTFTPNSVVDFLPKRHNLVDHRSQTETQQSHSEDRVKTLGLDDVEEHALSYIFRIQRRWFTTTHPGSDASEGAKLDAVSERNRLDELIHDLLGIRLSFNLDQQPTLFGLPLAEAKLSHGQGLLLQMAVMLHAQGAQLDGLVLLLDEPECHLHPVAVVDAIERLRALNKVGQIWIATHCVPVLAAMPPEAIWYISDGGASWAGRRPEVVLEGLLGGSSGRERVEEFLRLPAQFASNRFAAECLVAPKSVLTGADDPQARQIREYCKLQVQKCGRLLKVLDFGAGQGRLLSALHEGWSDDRPFSEVVEYKAFEPYEDPTRIERVLAEVYPSTSTRRVFARRDALATIDAHSLDIVVLCNVLHEIPPEEWPGLFGAEGLITRLLRTDGHLLVVEDMALPHGEKAHRFGFLLLDRPHLYKLMQCTEKDASIETVTAYDDRLKAHALPASVLGRVNRESTKVALGLLRDTAKEEILALRQGNLDSRTGRLHSLWTQMLANSHLALEAL